MNYFGLFCVDYSDHHRITNTVYVCGFSFGKAITLL